MELRNRDCENCFFKGNYREMVGGCQGMMVDYCTKGNIIYKAAPCGDEQSDEGRTAVQIALMMLGFSGKGGDKK